MKANETTVSSSTSHWDFRHSPDAHPKRQSTDCAIVRNILLLFCELVSDGTFLFFFFRSHRTCNRKLQFNESAFFVLSCFYFVRSSAQTIFVSCCCSKFRRLLTTIKWEIVIFFLFWHHFFSSTLQRSVPLFVISNDQDWNVFEIAVAHHRRLTFLSTAMCSNIAEWIQWFFVLSNRWIPRYRSERSIRANGKRNNLKSLKNTNSVNFFVFFFAFLKF